MRAALLLGLAWAMVACGDDWAQQRPEALPVAPDSGVPLGDRPPSVDTGEVPFSLPRGGAGDPRLGIVLSAGQVRAGRVTSADQLLSGIKSTARVGDYKIYNSRVAFIIGDERPSSGYAPYGGELLDAARAGTTGQSLLGEVILVAGVKLLQPSSVGVVSDGSDGKPAVVRVIGEPASYPLMASLLGDLQGPSMHIVIEYELAADSDALELRWRFFNRLPTAQQVPLISIGLAAGDGAQFFAEEVGFVVDSAAMQDYVAMIAPTLAYALASPEHQLTPLLQKEGVWILSAAPPLLPPGGEAQHRYQLALTDGEPEAVRKAMRGLRGQAEPLALTGVVRSGQGGLAGARVHVERDEKARRYVSMTRSDASGAYRLALGPGSYRVTTVADGRAVPAPVTVQIGSAPASLELAVPVGARLACKITDEKGPIPAKLTIKPASPGASLPASFGEPSTSGTRVRYLASGSASLALPAGSYTFIASRGFEYELAQSSVTLAAGEEKSLDLQLTRSVSTPGFMCGDFHVHAMWSPDSDDLYDFKVAALAGEGLEIPVITEHEYIGDLNPTIAKLGLQPWIRGVAGEEITTFTYGHFNAYPLVQDPSRPNQGAVLWYGKSPAEMFADVHATWPGAVLQVNHPRAYTIGGYFSWAGYDAATGVAKRGMELSRNFEALEVWNGAGWDAYLGSTVQDWYSFLDRGFLVTATGNSDSHHALWDHVGYPRNYVKLSTDEPANLNVVELGQNVREGHVVVSGGPFVTASIGSKSLGDVVDATAKKVTLTVGVQAPTWMPVDRLRVIVGGKTVIDQAIDASTQDPKNPALRFQKDLTVLVDQDSWLIVVATGAGSLAPVFPGDQPFAVTNPIYLDVNGNGVYDPPKSF
jgi:hypothetical protein